MIKQIGLFLVQAGILFAGQSIVLSTQTASNTSITAQSLGTSWRVEGSIHNWDSNASQSRPMDVAAVGMDIVLLNGGGGDLRLQLYSRTATNEFNSPCQIQGLGPGGPRGGGSIYTNRFLTFRFQQDVTNMVTICQAWDINGNKVWDQTYNIPSIAGTTANGAYVTGTGQNLDTAYFRTYTCTVAQGARPPVTADTSACGLFQWKFDTSLADSFGSFTATYSGVGSPTYVSTPGQNLVVPIIYSTLVANAPPAQALYDPGYLPSWATGATNFLDGTQSYSQADSTPTVSCAWTSLSGPTTPTITGSPSACTPTVTNVAFGDYDIQLTATDVNMNSAMASDHIGAVQMDSNGKVITGNAAVDFIFGPMIAFGKNPWGFQDYFALHATVLRAADYLSDGWITGTGKPQWETAGGGTVSYWFDCVTTTFCPTGPVTTLNGTCSATSASCAVTSAAVFDTTEFPTRVVIYDGTNMDEDRVCSVSMNTLNFCYDPFALGRHNFANGVTVFQNKVKGTGTHFLTDANSPVCPAGAGVPGPTAYSTGTVSLTAGSATVTGSGTAWTSAFNGYFIEVSATHSATPYSFVAQIMSVGSGTSITLARSFPSDSDTASGLTYKILAAQRTPVLSMPHVEDPSGQGLAMWGATGCESETSFYLNPFVFGFGNQFANGHDIPAYNNTQLTGQTYSVTDTTGWVNAGSTGGINFYGEDLAHRALYYRSGLNVALTAARNISNYWIRSPWANADVAGWPKLFLGGGGLGAFASAITDGSTNVSWSDLRGYAGMGVTMVNGFASGGIGCAYDDTRDSGWAYSWLILAAIYDPDTTSMNAPGGIPWRTYWQNQLAQMQTNDTNCERTDHSWSNGFLWNNFEPALTLTNGSTAGTGTAIPSAMCGGTGSGSATVTNGSAAVTVTSGSIPVGTRALVLTGTMGASLFTASYAISGSGSSATLAVFWPGDTGTVTWMSTASPSTIGDMSTIATSGDDLTDLKQNYACIWNSSSSITLNRPWVGTSGSSYFLYPSPVAAGYGQQPFFVGIKGLGMNYLAKQTLPALSSYATSYTQFTKDATAWINSTGYDSFTQGTYYARVFQFCEPSAPVNTSVDLAFRQSGCSFGNDPGAIVEAREENAEIGAAAGLYFDYNTNQANKTWGDTVYGSLWGSSIYNTGGVYSDSKTPVANLGLSNMLDSFIHGGKWTGFFLGAGMSHRWPAERLGIAPPSPPINVPRFTGTIRVSGKTR